MISVEKYFQYYAREWHKDESTNKTNVFDTLENAMLYAANAVRIAKERPPTGDRTDDYLESLVMIEPTVVEEIIRRMCGQ